jgi:translation elongation factor EF-G
LFGYVKDLRSLTDGKAAASMTFERYDVVEDEGTDPDDTFPAAAAMRA